MSKHTKGPWLHRGKSDSVHEACDTHPYGKQIFQFHGEDDELPSDADLSLILAAPDLLEALERCELLLRSKRHACEDNNLCHLLDSHISQARSAIVKARGES